ncbi:MAG: type IX secretion system membrane protein PorP/SprF [Salibacteraceae bacterium]
MRLHITIWLFVSMVFGIGSAVAQQDPKFNQYMFNPLGINPAYAGSREVLSTVLLYRKQWVGIDGAPTTGTFSIHGPFKNRVMGLGFQVTNDVVGPHNNLFAEVDYAYRFRAFKGKMAFGLGAGLQYFSFDWNKINYKDQGDYIPEYGRTAAASPDFDFGAFWDNNFMYFGLEVAHLTSPKIDLLDTNISLANNVAVFRQFRHVSFTAGRAFIINKTITLKPSMLYKQAGMYRGMLDLNLSVLIDNQLWIGVTVRPTYGGVLIFEYDVNRKLRIGYSFDYPLNSMRALQTQGTSHELFIGYEFGVKRKATVSPRYF